MTSDGGRSRVSEAIFTRGAPPVREMSATSSTVATPTQGDLALALLQMEMETLARIDHSLARLDEGGYGRCLDCDQEISEPRLRAMPFAVRCRACEVEREQASERTPSYLERPGGMFTNWVGF